MVISMLEAEATETARLEVEKLARQDPDLGDELRRVASELPSPPRCELGPS